MFDKIGEKVKKFVKENKVCQYILAHKLETVTVVSLVANLYLLGKCGRNEIHIHLDKDNELVYF